MTTASVIENISKVISAIKGTNVLFDPAADGPRDGQYTSRAETSLHSNLRCLIESEAPNGLYRHQHAAIESVLSGNDTIAATRTSSGKSLIFSLPALDAVCHDSNATSLLLYPQKALANDQYAKLSKAISYVPELVQIQNRKPHFVSRYDGSTLHDDRKLIRDQAQILITNPDMLHLGILQHHQTLWARFFKNLKLVAIDECHEYRGIFGTNVSYILRRLRQICEFHGSNPQFIATSATIADPQSHLRELVGCDFDLIGAEEDGSKQGRRKFWMLGGQEHYIEYGRKLAMGLVQAGLRVLVFCPSRITAERMLAKMRKQDGEIEDYVAVYRSGLKSTERETIEAQLRDGTKKLVFSTSALELGIDIGGLDVVVCMGLPNSMMSLWQRAGRVARAGREGGIILIPGDSPLDAYYARHPQELFNRNNESLALNLANERVACQHYACAVHETTRGESALECEILGSTIKKIQELRDEGKLSRPEFYCSDPHAEVSIRNTGESNYKLMCGNDTVGDIGSFHLLREAPRGALYRHNGKIYRVTDVIRGEKIVRLRPERTRNDTVSLVRKKIKQKYPLSVREYFQATLAIARIDVTEFLQAVTEKDASGKTIRVSPGTGMPTHYLPTEGVALALRSSLVKSLQSQMKNRMEVVLGSIERLMANLFPIVSGPCDSQDFSSGIDKTNAGDLVLYLYDNVYDGVNLTAIAFDNIKSLLEKVEDRILSCDCAIESGCVRCIADPMREASSSKADSLLVARTLIQMFESENPATRHFPRPDAGLESATAVIECLKCTNVVSATTKFCPECGTRIEELSHVAS
ncbi:MAG: DEAD/DEAH box helicase [Pirellulaceae bacterium]|nr:DEAD/DEAH box helicase [Pirellulaceae bacterium]